jgi:hypothetical protein
MDHPVTDLELVNLYRTAKSTFLQLHRLLIRQGLMSEQERIIMFDLTQAKKERKA